MAGGVANPGSVVRLGDTVRRPAPRNATSVHGFLEHLVEQGFEAPRPLGRDSLGREVLSFIPGDVPIPPYPRWALTDEALASIGLLLRRYHDAASSFVSDEQDWSGELRDPRGGGVICHNDVCLENVVFRDGQAVALLDFDFAGPGRPIWDLAMTAGMCVPIRPPQDPLPGQGHFDPSQRLAVLARAYGAEPHECAEIVDAIIEAKTVGAAFVKRHVEAGEEGFVAMVAAQEPGAYDARLAWLRANREHFIRSLRDLL